MKIFKEKNVRMRFYIASGFSNIAKVRELSQLLKLNGYTHTYNWTDKEAETISELAAIGEEEKTAITASDIVIVILPAGKGSHVELGIALAQNKKTYLFSPTDEYFEFEQTSTFYHLEGVNKFVGSLELFSRYLIKEASLG